MKLVPVTPHSPQDALSKAIATELAIEGLDPGSALPIAIGVMAAIQKALDADDAAAGVAELRESRARADRWWVENHPDSSPADAARRRLGLDTPAPPAPRFRLAAIADGRDLITGNDRTILHVLSAMAAATRAATRWMPAAAPGTQIELRDDHGMRQLILSRLD
jgi:hypothetical protein